MHVSLRYPAAVCGCALLAGCAIDSARGETIYLGIVRVENSSHSTGSTAADISDIRVFGAWIEPATGAGAGYRDKRTLAIPQPCTLIVIAEDARIAAEVLALAAEDNIDGDRLCVTG